jgi:outer membrane protein assembly factor BamB
MFTRYVLIAAGLLAVGIVSTMTLLRPREAPTETPAAAIRLGKPHSYSQPWNCFRGPEGGVAPWTNAPVAWDGPSLQNVVWKTPLEASCVSSPVLWENHVYLTEADESGRRVRAFDAETGKELWRHTVPDGGKEAPLPPVSDAALAMPTPACNAAGLYVLFGTGDLAAFSHDGRPRWQIFLKRPEIGYGFASSPCVAEGLVCVQFDELNGGRVLAVESATGKVKWEQPRSRGPSWASPLLVSGPDGKPLIVVNANGSATAYDLTGKTAWDVDGVNGQVTPSPAWSDNRVYLANNGSKLLCYDVAGKAKLVWQQAGRLPDVASPVVVHGLFFMVTSGGQLMCIDAATGQAVWTHKSPRCYASLVASGDRVYALGRDGTMQIVAAEPTYHAIGTCSLGEGSDATPALGDGRIYIRGHNNLWCIGAQ